MIRQARWTMTAVALLIPLIQGCAQSGQMNSNTPSGPQQPVPDLPEAHGPMKFEPEYKQPTPSTVDAGSNPSDPTAQKEEAVALPVQQVTVPEHPKLCHDAYTPGKTADAGLICPRCERGEFQQPAPKRAKIDLLFVADTSPSLDTERGQIAAGIHQFINQLPKNTDYNVAVMAAHSDVSFDPKFKRSTGLAGQLIRVGSEPAVLKGSDYRSLSQLSQVLVKKLTGMRADGASDGGELGLFSLDKGISEPLLSKNRKLGFFRPDAALAIIFVSDENDLCSYGVNYPEGVTPKANVNKYLDTGLTVEEAANKFYCRDASGTPTVTSRSVFTKLRNLKKTIDGGEKDAMPLLVSGILYTEEASVPTTPAPDEKHPEYFTENEVGYGYLDLIRDNQGVAVDISKGNFDEGLRQIGQAAALKLEVKSEFQLKNGVEIDPNTMCVMVDGREVSPVEDFSTRVDGLSYLFKSDLREVQLRGIGATNSSGGPSKVEIFYCEPPSVINYNPELYSAADVPTRGEHYRNLPVPSACQSVKARIESGALDGE